MQKSQIQTLKQWDKKYIWHPFTQMKDWETKDPLVIDSAEGIYLKDIEGHVYMDGVSSLWVNVHGHRHPRIDKALHQQIDRLSHSTLLGLSHTTAIELSKRLVEIAPKGLKKVFYSDNGSTAVEIALKMAYQYWQNKGHFKKMGLIHLGESYHGDTLGAVSVGGIDIFHQVYRRLIFKTLSLQSRGWGAVEELEKLLHQKAHSIAALVVEPLIQGAAGMLVWPDGVLKKMRALTLKHDVLLIVDEVATGFGRTGKMFACEHEGVSPDFLCIAKGVTGGYLPLAATLTTQKVYNGFLFDMKEKKTFFHGHTYTGNPLACAAALANLEVFRKERTLQKLLPKIKYLTEKLKMFKELLSVKEIRQKGFMVAIELKGPQEEFLGTKVCQYVRRYGVILRPLGNCIVLMPPLSISIKELDYLLMATFRSIEEAGTFTKK
ncbi:MAG: adenosylmethionine--8-amino-7-oxononanoate transaminase [Candidatus Omnitrophica bacterium]|nr:adenosylmethionine--8-amino-7-oxononanoate transaminase [Candidatus Omnitrophota bacterium]